MYSFDKKQITDFKSGNSRCFLLTNGIGGYACGSLINSLNRKHYGYLIACLKPPVDRVLVLAKIKETLKINNQIINLDSDEFKDQIIDNHEYLDKVTIDSLPTFYYQTKDVKITKTIALKYGKNVSTISYTIDSNKDGYFELTPYFNFRDHGDVSTIDDLKFIVSLNKQKLSLIPDKNKNVTITFEINEGQFIENNYKFTDALKFGYDSENGDDRVDYNFIPYNIRIKLEKDNTKKINIIVKVNDEENYQSEKIINEEIARMDKIIKDSLITDPLGKDLVIASDRFLAYRSSTNLETILAGLPWFTDWGRDTMISYTGIALVPRRFTFAKEILASFAKYEKNGLIPNMFPDDGGEPIYNTVDASLWYFFAAYKYAIYTKDTAFIKETIYPVLKRIIKNYTEGTDFSIKMDDDYLIMAGSDQDQITWMDVRTHGVAVTPRHGKPVEINALWYNALMTMDYFSKEFNDYDETYLNIAKEVKINFNKRFYNEKTKSLYDVIDKDDPKVRPNQVFIYSLPFIILEEKYQKEVFETITKELYNKYGLRSLSINDPEFKPKYTGSLDDRDYAYHMGTTWGFLIGGYLDGFAKVYHNSKTLKADLQKIVNAFIPHLNDGCIGGIAEVFDGDIASSGKGCFSQAWSVGELLRSYYENILSKN